jgi:hypothetical protein
MTPPDSLQSSNSPPSKNANSISSSSRWSGPGACLEGLRCAEGKPRQAGWIAKQDETEQTVYRKNQTRPNNLYSLQALRAPNTLSKDIPVLMLSLTTVTITLLLTNIF